MSDEEVGQQVVVLYTALQLYQEKTERKRRGCERRPESVCVCEGDALAVPVVDLLDVAEDDLVLPSHVFWNSSDFQPGHETLRDAGWLQTEPP